jgi:hypothetical protein
MENQSQMKCIKLLIPTKFESNEGTLKMELISIIPDSQSMKRLSLTQDI